MTLTEVLVVVFVAAMLVVLMLTASLRRSKGGPIISCLNNLKEIGISFKIWEGDNNGKNPMEVSLNEGGVMELAATGNVAAVFQVMSNSLNTTRLLICPQDAGHKLAANFTTDFSNKNVSYFVGLDAATNFPNSILAGDDNFQMNGLPVKSGVLRFSTNSPIAWTEARHRLTGNILLADGSVRSMLNSGLANAITSQYTGPSDFTNRFRIAIP